MPSKHPQFNRRLPVAVHQAIKRLAKKWEISEAKAVERAIAIALAEAKEVVSQVKGISQ